MAVPRFIYPNNVLTAGAIITASSEEPGLPAANLSDQARGKAWRSLQGWDVAQEFNDELPFLTTTDNVLRLAQIVPGNYATPSAYATAVTSAFAAAGATPKQSSAKLWVRSDSVTLDSSGRVSQMTDLSGNGNHLTQSTANLRPLYVANAVDGRPGLYFDGTASMGLASSALMSALLGANGIGTVICVFRLDSDAAANDSMWSAGASAHFMWMQWSGGTGFTFNLYDTADRAAAKSAAAGVSYWHWGMWRYDQINITAYVDSAEAAAGVSTAATGAQHTDIMNSTFKLGGQFATLKGYLLEAAIFPTALSLAGRRRQVYYLRGRYPSVAANDGTTADTFADVLTTTYDSATKKFTTARTAGAGNFTLYGTVGASTPGGFASHIALKDLGYTLADKTGAATYTAENVAYQGRRFVKIDMLTAQAATAGIVLDHNSGASAGTYTVEGNADDLWTAPTLSEALSGDATKRLDYWASQSFRYWRLTIEDVQNTAGYSEVGKWHLGVYAAPSVCFSQAFNKVLEPLSTIGYGDHGSHFPDSRPTRWAWNLDWSEVPDADRTFFETLVDTLDIGENFFVAWDPTGSPSDVWYVMRRDPFQVAMVNPSPYWNIPFPIVQVLP